MQQIRLYQRLVSVDIQCRESFVIEVDGVVTIATLDIDTHEERTVTGNGY